MNTYADRERIMAQDFLREFSAFYCQEIAPALAQLQAVNFSDGEPAVIRSLREALAGSGDLVARLVAEGFSAGDIKNHLRADRDHLIAVLNQFTRKDHADSVRL